MIVRAVRCDLCRAQKELEPRVSLPPGWRAGVVWATEIYGHLCPICMADWNRWKIATIKERLAG